MDPMGDGKPPVRGTADFRQLPVITSWRSFGFAWLFCLKPLRLDPNEAAKVVQFTSWKTSSIKSIKVSITFKYKFLKFYKHILNNHPMPKTSKSNAGDDIHQLHEARRHFSLKIHALALKTLGWKNPWETMGKSPNEIMEIMENHWKTIGKSWKIPELNDFSWRL